MYLLFNDLIYLLICEERGTYTDEVYSPIIAFYSASKATKVFTGTFLLVLFCLFPKSIVIPIFRKSHILQFNEFGSLIQ